MMLVFSLRKVCRYSPWYSISGEATDANIELFYLLLQLSIIISLLFGCLTIRRA